MTSLLGRRGAPISVWSTVNVGWDWKSNQPSIKTFPHKYARFSVRAEDMCATINGATELRQIDIHTWPIRFIFISQ